MNGGPQVTVIIVNRDRVVETGRALQALTHQTYRNFELVVVSNQLERLAARWPLMARAHRVSFDAANISAARNAGVEAAAGEIIAFVDDDAVPEPTWLARLVAPFEDPDVAAVGGIVRGRNGVSVQWGPQEVDQFGNDWALPLEPGPIAAPSQRGRALKTPGTNCAFRAEVLRAFAFDPAYRFFLDETDLNWRMARAGLRTVLVPDAEVHHGYASSAYRTGERVPLDLEEIGASKAYYCARHGDPDRVPEELDGFRKSQKARLIRFMELGLLAPRQIRPLRETLETGFVAGGGRIPRQLALRRSDRRFTAFVPEAPKGPPILLVARLGSRRRVYAKARSMAADGHLVTMFDFSLTARMMTVRFSQEGFWLHTGGIFGRTERSARLLQPHRIAQKIANERMRIAAQRGFDIVDK